ncbi:sulfatase [Halorientalis sp. IM1011]|uniref:sulfatase n=1 Tax=Halorientalis sp. IM1011 TaxID=1932360 RepID=UPI00097CC20F|nr:sulfatase [Halorientalis sp. IM1011]AQL41259.1 sulfatase [Halorientalis sp. IM1011]
MAQNVVLVTVDSLRADHVGCYGYDRDTTPELDAIAEDGHRFSAAFTHACATRPSFPAIMTSSHPLMYGGFERLSEERTLVSEVLSRQGYATGGFHSNLYLSAEFGYDRGFDTLYDSRADPSPMTRLRQAVKDNLDSDGLVYRILEKLYQGTERAAGVDVGSYYVSAEDITDRALEWVDAQGDRPTFLWVHYMDPHHPYSPPEEHQMFSDISRREGVRLRPKMMENDEDITEEELQTLIDLYDGEIRYTDAQIGRLLSTLEDEWDDWTAIVTADHGEEFRDHGEFFHQNRFYDEVMHVPLIVYDGDSSGTHDEMVGLMDVAPTAATLAGVETLPENFYGYPLDPLLDGRSEDWEREGVLGSWYDVPTGTERFAYRTTDWKYIRDYVHDNEELYDLQADPDEQSNLLDDDPEPDVLDEMRRVVDDLEEDIEATDTEVESVEMDDEIKERLRNLGYQE